MRIDEFEGVTKAQLNALENVLDKVFAKLGIDVEFTRHFLDRVNDERNIKQITIKELGNLFAKEFKKWGKPIAQMGPDAEAVMKDLSSDINLPFALNWNKQSGMLELVAKTVMRKKNFRTPDKEFPVESAQVEEDLSSLPPLADLIVMAVLARTSVDVLKGMWKTAKLTGKGLKALNKLRKASLKIGQGIADYAIGEAVNKDEFVNKLAAQQQDKFFKAALAALDRLVKSDPRGQSVGGYAFDIARAFEGINGRELARVYDETK